MLADIAHQLCTIQAKLQNSKRCGRCGETKDLSEFGTHTKRRSQRWCKQCHKEYNREWYRVRGKALRAGTEKHS